MAKFEDAIGPLLVDEGGYVFDPLDPGGETKYGISKRTYPNVDIKNLTPQQASDIYQRDFWHFDGLKSQPVANKLFNEYVNIEHKAIRLAQIAAGMTQLDGMYGGNTETAINAMDPDTWLTHFRNGLVNYYENEAKISPVVAQDLNGLLRRAKE